MEDNKLERLNELFEKAIENNVSFSESCELKLLYSSFIDDGRESISDTMKAIRNKDSMQKHL